MLQTRIFLKFCYDLNLEPRKWFEVIAHPLPKESLWVKYLAKQMKGKTDEQTDGQTDYYRAPAKQGPNK